MEIWYQVYTNDGTPNFGFAIFKSELTGNWLAHKIPNTVGYIKAKEYQEKLLAKGYSIMRITKLPNETDNSN